MDLLLVMLIISGLVDLTRPDPVSRVNYTITDDSEGFKLGNIRVDANLDALYQSETKPTLTYKFLTENKVTELFSLQRENSLLSVAKKVDRDELCPNKEECVLSFDVVVQPVQYFHIIEIRITITDVNDNPPVFNSDTINISILESTPIGDDIIATLPSALDPDSPENSIKSYRLGAYNDIFELIVHNPDSPTGQVQMKLKKPLDRESWGGYETVLTAVDGGKPPLSGSATLSITVLDVNDNYPAFTNSPYKANVAEDIPKGRTVVRVTAHDGDSGDNGRVSYELGADTDSSVRSVFQINKSTGDIITKQELDYEQVQLYHLVVVAKDSGTPSKSATASVEIAVIDQNDNSPEITLQSASSKGFVLVSEYRKPNESIAHVSISDKDLGTNGEFNCNFNDTRFTLRHIYRQEYNIILLTSLDREVLEHLWIRFSCVDKGTPPRQDSLVLPIKVVDENDNMPEFTTNTFTFSLQEDTKSGVSVYQVTAYDKDAGNNALITYSLDASVGAKLFNIGTNDGIIYTKSALDYEIVQEDIFYVYANDNGKNPITSTATMTVKIQNVNDERPIFGQQSYEFYLDETPLADQLVGQVVATDRDLPPYNEFKYYLVPSYPNLDIFRIDSSSGIIYTTKGLDREETPVHSLRIIARDSQDTQLTSATQVIIRLTDINDNDPIIFYPNSINDTVNIPLNTPPGVHVTTVMAHDVDEGNNSLLTYSFGPSNLHNPFIINKMTGMIYLGDNKDLSKGRGVYELDIVVADNGSPHRYATSTLTIIVNSSMVYPLRPSYNQNKEQNNDNTMIVIVVGCVAGVIIVALSIILFFLLRGQRKRERETDPMTSITIERKPTNLDDNDSGVVLNQNLYDGLERQSLNAGNKTASIRKTRGSSNGGRGKGGMKKQVSATYVSMNQQVHIVTSVYTYNS